MLQRVAEGDVNALGTLFDQMARPVYSLVMQLLRSHDEAEDIVESTFWQAWQDSGQLLESDHRAWLLAAGRRRALDHLRARRRQREDLLQDKRQFGDLVTASAAEPTSDESHQTFLRRLRDLSPEERQILELGYFRGLSQADISELTGDNAQNIKARMRSAMAQLRNASDQEAAPE